MDILHSHGNQTIKVRFLNFINNFTISSGSKPYRLCKILKKFVRKNIILNINLSHIAEFDVQLYLKIKGYPSELTGFFEYILNAFFNKNIFLVKNRQQNKIKVNFWHQNLNNELNIQEISPRLFNKLISIHGRIIKLTKNFSELSSILFKCAVCEFETYSLGEMSNIQEPIYCYLCKNFNSFQILYNRSYFNKIKFFKIQNQSLDNVVKNYNVNILVISRNHLTRDLNVGDKIRATGILRINPFFDKIRKVDSVFFGVYLDSLCLFKSSKNFKPKKIYGRRHLVNFWLNLTNETFEDKLMFTSLVENLNFYNFFQDSCFNGQLGIETLKKTLATIYFTIGYECKKSNSAKTIYLNLLINNKNCKNNSIFLKNIFSQFQKYVYINGKIEDETLLIPHFESKEEYNGNRLVKGKILNSNRKICFFENLNFASHNTLLVLKELITNHSVSIVRSGVNCSMEIKSSIVATINSLDTLIKIDNLTKKYKNFFNTLVNLFELTYILKIPIFDFFEKYIVLYFTHNFFNEARKIKSDHFNLKKVGLKSKGIFYFVESTRRHNKFITSLFSTREVMKLGNLIKILLNLKFKKQVKNFQNFLETTKTVARGLSKFRMSKLIAVEDIRLAFLTISECMKSCNYDEN